MCIRDSSIPESTFVFQSQTISCFSENGALVSRLAEQVRHFVSAHSRPDLATILLRQYLPHFLPRACRTCLPLLHSLQPAARMAGAKARGPEDFSAVRPAPARLSPGFPVVGKLRLTRHNAGSYDLYSAWRCWISYSLHRETDMTIKHRLATACGACWQRSLAHESWQWEKYSAQGFNLRE